MKMADKVDFKKTLRYLYDPINKGFHMVDVPELKFLMIDGKGNPNTSTEYQQAVEALYSLSYGIKFALKAEGYDHVVSPLEGLWWMENMNEFTLANKDSWEWTMMIMQPEWVSEEWVEKVRGEVFKKKRLPLVNKIRFENFAEGLSVQFLYTGAYEQEAPTISEMHNFIKNNGFTLRGKHHEIYLNYPNKTALEKLLTILRQPIQKI